MELTRKAGESGLAVALGPQMPVGARKAYRLSSWCRPIGGHAGLRIGWIAAGAEVPFAWSGTGLSDGEGERGGTWFAPEGAATAQIECVVAGDIARAAFDDVDFAEAALSDRPPVVGRAVQAAFESPGVFFLATRNSAAVRGAVGIEGADATCAVNAKRTATGGSYEIPNPAGGATIGVTEERDAEGEGFVVKYHARGSGVRLTLATGEAEVDGRLVAEPVKTARVTVGRGGGRVVLDLRPDAEVQVRDGHVLVRFPGADFEVAFLPESGGGLAHAGLEEASKAESTRQFGKALQLYDAIVERNPKGDLGTAAAERAEALRTQADAGLRRARYRRSDAEFTGKVQSCDDAVTEYMAIEREFDGSEYAAQARAEREGTEELRKQLSTENSDPEVAKLMALANAYFNEGRLALARAYCEAVLDRTTDPDAAVEVDGLLQRIDAKEKE